MQLAGYHPATSAVWAGALFAAVLQRSGKPSPGQVRKAVAAAIRAYGGCWCAGRVAQESGDHPETAVEQMRCAGQWPETAGAAEDLPADPRDPDVVRTKALARCDSQLQGTPPEGWDLAAQPRAAAEDPARNHGKALAQTGAAYRPAPHTDKSRSRRCQKQPSPAAACWSPERPGG
jgi:hypothetical protein